MTYYSSELNCPYCATPLTGQEIEYIRGGTSVRCRGCGTFLSQHSFESPEGSLIEQPVSQQASVSPGYQQPPPRKGSGALVFFIGFIILSLGLYSWFIYIPIFSDVWYGELLGAIAVVKGLSDFRKESGNPSAINIIIVGLALWIAAWASNLIYIPILSDGYIGEFGGLGLIIFGYLQSRRY